MRMVGRRRRARARQMSWCWPREKGELDDEEEEEGGIGVFRRGRRREDEEDDSPSCCCVGALVGDWTRRTRRRTARISSSVRSSRGSRLLRNVPVKTVGSVVLLIRSNRQSVSQNFLVPEGINEKSDRLTLRHYSDGSAQIVEPDGADVDAVDEDLPLGGLQSPEQRRRQRRLSRPRPADDGDLVAGLDREGDVLQGERQVVSVSRRVVDEFDGSFRRPVCRGFGFRDLCGRFRVDVDVLLDPLHAKACINVSHDSFGDENAQQRCWGLTSSCSAR